MTAVKNVVGIAFALLSGASLVANAQSEAQSRSYPERPIRLILPIAAGGATDIVARLVSNELNKSFGQPVVIDNRPGGDGIVGSQAVARATPDGYTLLFALSSHTTTPFLHDNMPYDAFKDFAAITEVATQPMVLLVNPSLSSRSVGELVALAKSSPRGINAGHAGGVGQMATEILKMRAGIERSVVSIGYKGGAQSMTALLSGETQFAFVGAGTAMGFIKPGKLLVIATAGQKRSSFFPDITTVSESGLANMDIAAWQGVLAPAATPRAVVNRLNVEIVKLLKLPEVMERLAATGSEPVGSSPEQFSAKIKQQLDDFGPIIKASLPANR